MGRRDESPEKKQKRAMIEEFLKEKPIKDGNTILAGYIRKKQ